ncbi:uncharacterized protein B0P05DRAFT_118461 [Gilbertella persicaria]|uniref:uncharacterized protein n=1 Tax=Gilbertella persicaria TaxID=101096 RepID=UPI00221EE4C6|nr:uncharacterized protein B0P05DRAFT_118461 [Gilbertella persicaria]KAI8077945.1 hypothetical protein B0P05DRAFT_118461 [Gilbertella persicaria]
MNREIEQQRGGLERHSKELRDICTNNVSVLLSQHSTASNRYLKNLSDVSSDVAERLVKNLKEKGKLNASTLRKLTDHCYLQNVLLDSYTYCTDSLVEDLSKSNSSISITKVSLRGCDVITDNGIRSLIGLKNLDYLDLNNCKITDKGLKSLEQLHYLGYLNLSKTKITDRGIASMISNSKFKEHLQVLLLDGCSNIKSSNTLVPVVNEFPNLLQLSLANTLIGQQETSVKLRKNVMLEHLDVSHTGIDDQVLIQIISQFKQLSALKLSACLELSTRALSFLPRELKRLKQVQFPNRKHELDGVLARYRDLPLEYLDLGSFDITDEGAQHIACMKHLRFLSLEGTKVTNQGTSLFKNLVELEKLHLDRTVITDEGVASLGGVSKLDTLSLCHTGVSNATLKLFGDYEKTAFTRCLRSLNLAQCILITDKGIRHLRGMVNLTNLNLDHTSVTKSCLKYLKDLKHLKPVRLLGIEKEEEEDTD